MAFSAADRSPAHFAGTRSFLACLALLSGGHSVVSAAADISAASAETTPLTAPQRPAHQHSRQPMNSLDQRMQLLTKELDLDPQQQDSIRTILLVQRSEVIKAWNVSSVPAAIRVSALQGITERTADRIRSVLTDAQREKYLKSRTHDTPVGAPGGDVEKWMQPAQPH